MHTIVAISKFHCWKSGIDEIRIALSAGNCQLAYKLNKVLNRYPEAVRFLNSDEPQFIFKIHQLQQVSMILDYKLVIK